MSIIYSMDDIIENIIKLLNGLGITGKELGQILGLKKSPVTDWKNKKSKPTLEQILIILEHFDVESRSSG